MIVLGLTGGIGSGKSAAASAFEKLGVPVIDADVVARDVVEPGSSALAEIEQHFGAHVITDSGILDRARLRKIVFENASEKKWLEALLHPLIRDNILNTLALWREQNRPLAILCSPLMFETGQDQLVDQVIVVDVSEETQIQRASQRDGSDEATIAAIIDSQMPRQERLAKADFILNNEGSLNQLNERVNALYRQLTHEFNH